MALNSGYAFREQLGPDATGRTALSWLVEHHHGTDADWGRRFAAGEVELRGTRASPDDALAPGDWLVWHRPPWVEADVPRDFAVLFEDAWMLAVAKPSGLPTLPGGGFLDGSLLSLVRRRHPEASPMHRLGRATSGLVLFARTSQAAAVLQRSWRARRPEKTYRALASGAVTPGAFTIDRKIGPIAHAPMETIHAASPGGKAATSHVEVVEQRRDATLVDVRIETGRPHQIRIHLAAVGHPLVGDPLYVAGGRPAEGSRALPGDPGYHLHAWKLVVDHPETGRRTALECAPPPILRVGGARASGED